MSTESKPSNSTESKPNNSLEILSLLFSSINKNHEAKKSLETIKNSDNISSDIFEQSIITHLTGHGCPKCSPSYKDCKNSFIQKFFKYFPEKK